MSREPKQITLGEWDSLYGDLKKEGYAEPAYGGPLSRHLSDGDLRLKKLLYDNSPASLELWNFLLTEEDRLRQARASGKKLVGAMKDLGTVPVISYSFPNLTAFYPDGAWWIPCIMELSANVLEIADSLGIDESFCPVRAMMGAFATGAHFPIPDALYCSVGATCDDFSAIAQRLQGMGHPIEWWEIPQRRVPSGKEESVVLPGGLRAPVSQVKLVRSQLEAVKTSMERLAEMPLTTSALEEGIANANTFRGKLAELRELTFTAEICPLPALEMLIAEMLTIHFCSDQNEAVKIIDNLLEEVKKRVEAKTGFFEKETVKVFWVNPVADIRIMNFLEELGGRICGTEYLFAHALTRIPTDLDPMEALARTALADPMVGPSSQRAEIICRDMERFGSEALIMSRIPGASHCALESAAIADIVASRLNVPTLEITVPPVSEPVQASLKTRIQGLIETVRRNRKK